MTTATIEERVAKGAALMDEKVPGWEKRIDKSQLNTRSCFNCIIGQVFGVTNGMFGFSDAAESIGLISIREIADHGFDSYPLRSMSPDIATEHADLRTAWLAEIARRINSSNVTEAKS